MCGIFLWINRRGEADVERAAAALMVQNHRGPDNQAIWIWDGQQAERIENLPTRLADGSLKNRRARVILGNNRLAINDPTPRSNQPMFSPCGNGVITFNGCIYNFVELRQSLEAEGQTFTTTGDTEVLLRWLMRHGQDGARQLNGAWAFALMNLASREILMSRDRYGERPLFYSQNQDDFIAASEIKTIYQAMGNPTRRIDPEHLMAFIAFNKWPLIDGSRTFYRGIERLMPGHSIRFNLDSFSFQVLGDNTIDSFLEQTPDPDQVAEDVRRAVSIRLRADVPVAILFSGGVDSTLVGAFAAGEMVAGARPALYTAQVPKHPDLAYARRAAGNLGVDLIEVPYRSDIGIMDEMRQLTRFYDLPVPFYGTTIGVNTLYKALAADGLKCVLDGTGGDEIFGGYKGTYVLAAILDLAKKGHVFQALDLMRTARDRRWIDMRSALRYGYGTVFGPHPSTPLRHLLDLVRAPYRAAAANSFRYFPERDFFRKSLRNIQVEECLHGRLPDFTAFADGNSMMHSVENRSPFLDVTLAKYMNLPVNWKYRDGFNKFALRRAVPQSLDHEIAWRPQKIGAPSRSADYFRENETKLISDVLKCSLLSEVFDVPSLIEKLQDHPYRIALLLSLHSVAILADTYSCEVAGE